MSFQTILQVILGLIGLSFLVFIHELGHYIAARLMKIRIKTFSIGFGSPLFTWKRKGIEYRISAIPFGGYVAMAGEKAEDDDYVPQEGDFSTKSIPARIFVAAAGPGVNLIFAFVVIWALFIKGTMSAGYHVEIAEVMPDSPAAAAGFQAMDVVKAIDGDSVRDQMDFIRSVATNIDTKIPVVVQRGEKLETLQVTPLEDTSSGLGRIGVMVNPGVAIQIMGISDSNGAAFQAGLRAGDTILSIQDRPILSAKLMAALTDSLGKASEPMRLLVASKDGRKEVSLDPQFDSEAKKYRMGVQIGGVYTHPPRLVQYGPIQAFSKAGDKLWEMCKEPFDFIPRLIKGQVGTKAMTGAVGITSGIGRVATMDLTHTLLLLAYISVNLAIINLLPLVVTDGGVILLLLLEAVFRRPISKKILQPLQMVVFGLFMALFLFVTFQDVQRSPGHSSIMIALIVLLVLFGRLK